MAYVTAPQVPEDPRQVVRSLGENGAAVFGQVGINEIDFTGRFGALVTSSSSNDISIGDKYFVLDFDDGKFRINDDVLITSVLDKSCFMWGEIVDKVTSTEPAQLRVYIDDVSDLTGTFANWEIQVVARPKPGIEKDVSTSTVSIPAIDSDLNTMTFTIQSDKFFPIGGKLLIKDLTNRTKALIGKVLAYSGTTLIVDVVAKTTAAAGSSSSWSIALLDAPQDKVALYSINGLRILVNASDPTHDIDITAGSVRDSTDTVDLVLGATKTKQLDATFVAGSNQGSQVLSANLAGTASKTLTNITGVGSAFTSDFTMGVSSDASLNDLTSQYFVWKGAAPTGLRSVMTINTTALPLATVTSTTAATSLALGNIASSTYKRGGWVVGGVYAVLLIRKDSDGSVDVCTCALGNGTPDLPSGYTYYRVIGLVSSDGFGLTITQPIQALSSAGTDDISVDTASWTMLPTLSALVTQPTATLQNVLDGTDFGFDAAFSQIAALDSDITTLQGQISSGDIGGIEAITGTGIVSRTAANTFATRTLTAGQNISITNPAGIAGDPTIALDRAIADTTYSPSTFTNVNLDANPTILLHQYAQIGGWVIVWGRAAANPTAAAGTLTSFNIDLPVTTTNTFAAVQNAIGLMTGDAGTAQEAGWIEAVVGTRRVKIQWPAATANNHAIFYIFAYRI